MSRVSHVCARAVGVDAVGIRRGGGAEILNELLGALLELDLEKVVVWVSPAGRAPGTWRHLREHTDPRLDVCAVGRFWDTPIGRLLWAMKGVGSHSRRAGVASVLHVANYGWCVDRPSSIYVHQPNAFDRDVYRRNAKFLLIRFLIRASVRRSDLIIVQNHAIEREVERWLGDVPGEIVHHVPVPSWPERDRAARVPDTPYLLYVGSAARHKNIEVLGAASLRGNLDVPVLATLDEADVAGLTHDMDLLGTIDDRDLLASYYENALAIVMPSRRETLGLPLLEAMSLGVPVIAADRPYAHYVCGDAAIYFDESDPADLTRAVSQLSDGELRRTLGAAGAARVRDLAEDRSTQAVVARLMAVGSNGDA